MKNISQNYLEWLLSTDVESCYTCDLITVTLPSGLTLYITDGQMPIAWNGNVYHPSRWGFWSVVSTHIAVGAMNASCDFEVYADETVLMPEWNDTLMHAIQAGLFDGALFTAITFSTDVYGDVALGGSIRFGGQITTINQVGGTKAEGSVKPYTFTMNQPMPKHILQPGCGWVFGDTGCTFETDTVTFPNSVGAGSTNIVIVPAAGWGSSVNTLMNQAGLVVNAYNETEGRQDYFPEQAGTSESQFLLGLGLLEAYQTFALPDAIFLAEKCLSHILPILYRNYPIPQVVTPTEIFAPHWLFAVKAPFVSAVVNYSDQFTFTNGVAVVPDTRGQVRYCYQAMTPGYTLIYQSPYSPPATGTAYSIASYAYNAAQGGTVVTLTDLSFSGTLVVIYSSVDGPLIVVDEPFEAFPDWRPLAAGEIDCACDTFNWAYRMFGLAATLLPTGPWGAAQTATFQQAQIAYNIDDSRDWLSPSYSMSAFSKAGTFFYSAQSPQPTFGTDQYGNAQVTVTAQSGDVQYGCAALNDTYAAGNTTEITVASTIAQTLNCFIDTTNQQPYNPANRYTATITIDTPNTQQTTTLSAANFINNSGETLPVGAPVYTFAFDDLVNTPHTLTVVRIRTLPNLSIKYYGGAIPFTANFLGNPATLISWQGPVYMGYQSPWMFRQLGNETNVATCLQMLQDSQAAYVAQVGGTTGPFAPVFYFDRPDAVQYGPTNTFGWNGPDPNTEWGGYQYRPLAETAALVNACSGTESYYSQAVTIVDDFLSYLGTQWGSSGGPPTIYPSNAGASTTYDEPHFAALILRAVLLMDEKMRPNGNASGPMNSNYQYLLTTAVNYLGSIYQTSGVMAGTFCAQPSGESWFGFWHGEILRTMCRLFTWANNPNIGETTIANQATVWADGMIAWALANSKDYGAVSGDGYFTQGIITMTSGLNAGLSGMIQTHANGTLRLVRPFIFPVALNDQFTATAGCDHTLATCTTKFSNNINFGGQPFIPNKETAL